jgi:hypothetical protein
LHWSNWFFPSATASPSLLGSTVWHKPAKTMSRTAQKHPWRKIEVDYVSRLNWRFHTGYTLNPFQPVESSPQQCENIYESPLFIIYLLNVVMFHSFVKCAWK